MSKSRRSSGATPRAAKSARSAAVWPSPTWQTFPLRRYPHDFLLPRILDLRDSLAAYDATYVALAEVLDTPLLTRDRRLAAAAGHRAQIELV